MFEKFKKKSYFCIMNVTPTVEIGVRKSGKKYSFYLLKDGEENLILKNQDWIGQNSDDNIFVILKDNEITDYSEVLYAYDKINDCPIELTRENRIFLEYMFNETRAFDYGIVLGLFASNPNKYCKQEELDDFINFMSCENENYPVDSIKKAIMNWYGSRIFSKADGNMNVYDYRDLSLQFENGKIHVHCLSDAFVTKSDSKVRTR